MPIKPGETNWIHNPLKYLEVDDLLMRKHPGKQASQNGEVIEIPVRLRKLIKAVLLALIPEKESKPKIGNFLKAPGMTDKIDVYSKMNLLCSFFYYLSESGAVKTERIAMENMVIQQFKFLKADKTEKSEASARNIFKPSNEKKKVAELKSKTANQGTRLAPAVVIDRIFKKLKASDAQDVKRQLEKLFSKLL